jgi:hypothetical protein
VTTAPRVLVALLFLPPALATAQVAADRAAGQPAGEMDAASFADRLDALARASKATTSAAEAEPLLRDLPPAWTVQVGRDQFTVPTAPIVDAHRTRDATTSWAATRDRAVARLEAMRDEARRLEADGPSRPAHVRQALGEVLAAPEFRGRQRQDALLKLWDDAKRWLRSWLPAMDDSGRAVAPAVKWFSWIVAAAAFVLLAGLVWRLLNRSTREARVRVRPATAREILDARGWAAKARAALAAGETREALRCAYHAVLHRLDEEGAWTIADARTPREYVRLLPAADRRHAAVSTVARAFERVWYGGAQPALADAEAAVTRLGELGCDAQADPAT